MNDNMMSFVGWVIWIVIIIGAIGYGIAAGFSSVKNLIEYGKFTTDTRAAMVEASMNDSHYFADLAKDAGITLTSWSISTLDGVPNGYNQLGATASFTFTNSSNKAHEIQISSAEARIILDGRSRDVDLDCSNIPHIDDFTVPAGGAIQFSASNCDFSSSVSGKAVLLKKPRILAIDDLPVTGGPSNTPWRCEINSNSDSSDFAFSNNC
jgi:hypothetical protein